MLNGFVRCIADPNDQALERLQRPNNRRIASANFQLEINCISSRVKKLPY